MTVIRLTRMGRNNPVVEPKVLKIDEERYNYWLSVGAKPSEKVKKLASK